MNFEELLKDFTLSTGDTILTVEEAKVLLSALILLKDNKAYCDSLSILLKAILRRKQIALISKYQDIDLYNNTCGTPQSREAYQVLIGFEKCIESIQFYLDQPNSDTTEYAVKSVNNSFLIKLKTIWKILKM